MFYMSDLKSNLSELAAKLISINSVSLQEKNICDFILKYLSVNKNLKISRIGNSIVARTNLGRAKRVILAGHIDTVPSSGNETPTFVGGKLYGLGACDMKGGIAVMMALARSFRVAKFDLTYIFYEAEEINLERSGLLAIEKKNKELLNADYALLLEPTNLAVEGGCQGVIQAEVTARGKRAHSARPWQGENAIENMAILINNSKKFKLKEVPIDGCLFRESLVPVMVSGGVATNVVPDKCQALFSYRFSPDKTKALAYRLLRDELKSLGKQETLYSIKLKEGRNGALPNLGNPFFKQLIALSNKVPKAKLGWTDVALFAKLGIYAANFGPGNSELAHSKKEFVSVSQLVKAYQALEALLGLK